jgi:hypothetical protein
MKALKRIAAGGWLWLGLTLLAIGLAALFGPAEKSLGVNVRVVYLHGAWVWTALAGFVAAAAAGTVGLVYRRPAWYAWSQALGYTGLVFWLTYLPLSLWAMQTNWNGLFLAEPRWRLALAFALGGLALQVGLALLNRPAWTALGNIFYAGLLFGVLGSTENVMHPDSPIFNSDARSIQIFFSTLLLLTLLAGGQIAWQIYRLRFQRAAA